MVVVDAQYVEPFTVDLAVQRKSVANSNGNFTVVDVNGNVLFNIKDTLFSFHDRHILYDANDKPVLTFKKKLRSIHGRWQAFKGERATHKDLIFSVKKSAAPKHETELDVFLVENKEETACDCKVTGDWETKSCNVYAQDGSTILAEVHDKQNITNVVVGKETFGITVYPDVDYVFIVALVVILTEIKSYDSSKKKKKKKKKKAKKSSDSSEDDKKDKEKKVEEEEEEKEKLQVKEEIKDEEEDHVEPEEQEEQKEEEEEEVVVEEEEDDDDDSESESDSDDYDDEEDDDDYVVETNKEEPNHDEYNNDEDDEESSSTSEESPKK
ncbi:hypothetical protein Lser_V15G39516 [Lactuca serriola]|uniref:Uncharacterized protein n=1 Tax=Lactuca sativa TaxID=4236 RepID=A0A9R1USU1_LACSA|nr:hypothetical protein LSAT_V11C800430680 [Lactuca sativa]